MENQAKTVYTACTPERKKKTSIHIKLHPDLLDEVDSFAKKRNVGRTRFIEDALREKIDSSQVISSEELEKLKNLNYLNETKVRDADIKQEYHDMCKQPNRPNKGEIRRFLAIKYLRSEATIRKILYSKNVNKK
jgi:hypothetical protein